MSGDPDTLVVGGSMRKSTDTSVSWASAAFNDLGGRLADMPTGKVLLAPDPNYSSDSGIVGLAAAGTETVTAVGHLLSARQDNLGDPSFGSARLLVDAEKRCYFSVADRQPPRLSSPASATRGSRSGWPTMARAPAAARSARSRRTRCRAR